MTNRQILERAADILERDGRSFTGGRVRQMIEDLPPDPLTPSNSIEIRIAMAANGLGSYAAYPVMPRFGGTDTTAIGVVKLAVSDITHIAIGVFMIPPIAVPEIEGKASP